MKKTLSIASGKGGTGKTTVSVCLSQFFSSKSNYKVQLIDCDVEEPNDKLFFSNLEFIEKLEVNKLVPEINHNKCNYCRKCAEYCEFNAIVVIPPAEFAEVNKDLCHSCGACLHACDQDAITEIPEYIGEINNYNINQNLYFSEGRLKIGSAMQTMLIRETKKKAKEDVDLQIIDSPPGTSCPVVESIGDTDYTILVTEPTPFGLHDLKLMVDLVEEMDINFGVIVNKSGMGNNDVYDFLKTKNIELLGEIPFSKDFAKSYANGNLLNINNPEIEISIKKMVENVSKKIQL